MDLLLDLIFPVVGSIVVLVILAAVLKNIIDDRKKIGAMSPEERQKYEEKRRASRYVLNRGHISPAMVCPHCREKGTVRVKPVERRKGIDGTKAAGAALTAGISLLFIGLSRKEQMTQAYCENCQSTWDF